METLLQDLRFSIRLLLQKPGFTVVAIITLALGIGANTAIFSVVNTVLLRPLPYNHPERLITLLSTNVKRGETGHSHSYSNFSDYRAQNGVFEAITAYTDTSGTLTGGELPEQVIGLKSSADLFKVLDVQPILGRTFTPDDEKPGGSPVALISYQMWQRRFGGNPNVIGQQFTLSGQEKTIIGVLPPNFQHLFVSETLEYFVPLNPTGDMEKQRGANYLHVTGRLKPGVTVEQAEAEMQGIASRLEQQYTDDQGESVKIISAHEDLVGNLRVTLLVLLGAVGFVLLIACANVANLQLTRAARRSREIAIRVALGAGRGRIVRQLLTESLVLSAFGGLLGLLIAIWGIDLISSLVPADIPRVKEAGFDPWVLGFTLGATMLTGIIFGLAPALQSSKVDLNEGLKEGGRGATEGRGRNRMRSLLIISEVALSLVLLVGAGLLIKSFLHLRNTKPGFNPERVLTAQVSLPSARYSEDPQVSLFYHQLMERAAELPGVEAIGAVLGLPLGDNVIVTSFTVVGQPDPGPGARPISGARIITPDYLRAIGIPLIEGRIFTDKDTADSAKVILINQTLAKRFFPNEKPIGKRLDLGLNGINGEIVGIVGDVRHARLDQEPDPEYYVPLNQVPINSMTLVVRSKTDDPVSLVGSLRGVLQQLDKDLPLYQIRPMERVVAESVARQRFSMVLLVVFAALALTLAGVGIFSVMSFLVAQRTHEIGVRMALGALPRDVLKLIVRQGMTHALIGIGIGLVGAFALTRLMSSLLFEVSTTDPITFVAISVILTGVSLAACLVPARRATKVDPMIALRYE